MKRKFVKVMFFGALALSTVTYVGCKDYDDDIDNLQTQIDANKASIAELQTFVKEGKWVTKIEDITGGFKITFNDGKFYSIVNGTNGTNGTNGSVVTIGSNGNWFIDNVDTGRKAQGDKGDKGDKGDTGAQGPAGDKGDTGAQGPAGDKGETGAQGPQGEAGKNGYSPKIENGYWYCYNDETEAWESTGIVAETTIYVVKNVDLPSWTLHVRDDDGNWVDNVILPTAGNISSMKGINIQNGVVNTQDGTAQINIKYGICPEDFTFDGKEYKTNDILKSETSVFYAMINPANIDFSGTDYKIRLTDSQTDLETEEAAYEVGSIKKYETSTPLKTRANNKWNKGVYELTVVFPKSATDEIISAADDRAYALSTKDAWGNEIISDYDINIKTTKSTSITPLSTSGPAIATIKDEQDLDELAKSVGVDFSSVVQYYYEIDGATPAGVTFDKAKKKISSTTGQVVNLKVYYLAVSGERFDGVAHGSVTKAPLSMSIKFTQDKQCPLVLNKTYIWDNTQNTVDALSAELMAQVKEVVGASYATLQASAFTSDNTADAFFTVGTGNALSLNIKQGFAGTTTAKLDIKVDANITVRVTAEVTVNYPAPALVKSDRWYAGTEDVKVSTEINSAKDAINVTLDAKQFFSNYATVKADVEAKGGAIKFKLAEDVTGVDLDPSTYILTIDPKTYEGDAIAVQTYFQYATEESDVVNTANVRKPDWLNGTLTVPAAASRAISIADRTQAVALTTGFAWKDESGKAMWPTIDATYYSGISTGTAAEKAKEALAVNGLKIVFEFDKTDAATAAKCDQFTIDQVAGTIKANASLAGLDALANPIVLKVNVKATSCWGGAIANANTALTVTLETWRK